MSVDLRPVAAVADSGALARPHDVGYRDGLAYVVGKGGTFAVLDVRVPSPRVLGTLRAFEDAQTVRPVGNYALVGDDAGVHVVDCSAPTTPTVLGTATADGLSKVNGVARLRGTLFCACKGGAVHALDVSALPSLSVVGRYDAAGRSGLDSPHDVAVVRDHLVVPNQFETGTPKLGAVRVVDAAADEVLPPAEWTHASSVSAPSMAGANRVAVRHPYVFVANNYGHTVTAVDAADLRDLRRVGEADVTAREPDGLALAGAHLLVGAADTLEAFDVSDPRAPRSVAVHRFDRDVGAHDLEVVDGTVYLTGQASDELHVLALDGAG